MSEPRFKVGDRVTWNDKSCTVTDGPFTSATFPEGERKFYAEGFLYVVQPNGGRAGLMHEDRLTRVERWEPCPGRHRAIGDKDSGAGNLERLLP